MIFIFPVLFAFALGAILYKIGEIFGERVVDVIGWLFILFVIVGGIFKFPFVEFLLNN